jgi:hypothetical protein
MGVDAHVATRLMGVGRHDALVIGRYYTLRLVLLECAKCSLTRFCRRRNCWSAAATQPYSAALQPLHGEEHRRDEECLSCQDGRSLCQIK